MQPSILPNMVLKRKNIRCIFAFQQILKKIEIMWSDLFDKILFFKNIISYYSSQIIILFTNRN